MTDVIMYPEVMTYWLMWMTPVAAILWIALAKLRKHEHGERK